MPGASGSGSAVAPDVSRHPLEVVVLALKTAKAMTMLLSNCVVDSVVDLK